MSTDEEVIEQTKRWINDVVIGCNFCPFAAKVVKQQTVFIRLKIMMMPQYALLHY